MRIAVVQPIGYVHSASLVDAADYVSYMFKRTHHPIDNQGPTLVFGAHLLPYQLGGDNVIVNLEQLGAGGAALSSEYIRTMEAARIEGRLVDYDADNWPGMRVPLLKFGFWNMLAHNTTGFHVPRDIDMLHFGSVNDRRMAIIEQFRAAGWNVHIAPFGTYGDERNTLLRRSNYVLNAHFYETARFEQVRAMLALSHGCTLVSEQSTGTPAEYEHCVHWFDTSHIPRREDVDTSGPDRFQEFVPLRHYSRLANDILQRTHRSI